VCVCVREREREREREMKREGERELQMYASMYVMQDVVFVLLSVDSIYVCICTFMYACMCVSVYQCISVYLCMHACTNRLSYLCIQSCISSICSLHLAPSHAFGASSQHRGLGLGCLGFRFRIWDINLREMWRADASGCDSGD
jgi:hypothetical protein